MNHATGMRLSLFAGALVIGLTPSGGAQANLFDFLFGAPAPQPVPVYRPSRPLDVRVNPRRRGGAWTDQRRDGQPRAGRPSWERKPVLVKSIDPVKNPNWHLEDPTLRPGDIVVLKGQVLVLEGGHKPRMREDFTLLEKSRYFSAKERELIQRSAGIVPGKAPDPKTPPAKQATLGAVQ